MKNDKQIPVYLNTRQDFRNWFIEFHDTLNSICLGFFIEEVGLPGITFQEALEEALCFGWVPGAKIEFDEISFTFVFIPRPKNVKWLEEHVLIMNELIENKRVEKIGLEKFNSRI